MVVSTATCQCHCFQCNIIFRQWGAIFLASFVTLLVIVLKGNIYMPLFTYFVALAFGAAATLPMSLVYAISGFSMKVGLFNELIVRRPSLVVARRPLAYGGVSSMAT